MPSKDEHIGSQQRVGVLGERGAVANLQHLRVAVAPPALNISAVGPAARRTSGVMPSSTNSIGEVVTVRVVAQHARPDGADPKPSEANSDIEVCTTGKPGELGRSPQVVFDGAVADQRLAERQHCRWRGHDDTVWSITARTARQRSRSADRSPPFRASPSSGPPMLTATAPAASHSTAGVQVDSARWDSLQVGERAAEMLEVSGADGLGRKDLDRGRAGIPAGGELGRGQATGKDRDLRADSKLDDWQIHGRE